jgi:hypothetical protein
LDSVNCLLGGAVTLPDAILIEAAAAGRKQMRLAKKNDDELPYVAPGPADPLDLPWQRSHQYGKHS